MAGLGDRADPSIRTGSILPSTRARNRMKLTAGIQGIVPKRGQCFRRAGPPAGGCDDGAPDLPPTERFRATPTATGSKPSATVRCDREQSYLVDPALLVSREIRGPFLREREPSCRRQSPKRRATAPSPRDVGRSHRIAPSIPAREHRRDAVRRRTRRPMQPRRQARRRLRPRRRG